MAILDRISSILKANINELLDKAEDPEKMLNQLIRDMEEGLKEAREAVVEAMADEGRLERKFLSARNQAKEWEHKAEVAVRQGNDEMARQALKEAASSDELADDLKLALETQERKVEELRAQLSALQAKIEEAKRKKHTLIARWHRVKAEQKIRESAAGLPATDEAFAAYERMKERIEDEELRAEALAKLEKRLSTEAEFDKMETEQQIEDRLAALKARLSAGKGQQ